MNPASRAAREQAKSAQGLASRGFALHDQLLAARLAMLAAVLLFVGGVTLTAERFSVRANSGHSFADYRAMNTTVLHDLWRERAHVRSLTVVATLLDSIGWMCAFPALLAVSRIAQSHPSTAAAVMLPAFALSILLTTMSLLFSAGTLSLGDWVTTWQPFKDQYACSDCHDGGWGAYQSLEISYMMSLGQAVWIDTFDQLALALALGASAIVGLRNPTLRAALHPRHGRLGCAASGLALLAGFSGVLRLASWRVFMIIEFLSNGFLQLIVLPVWLVVLGCQLSSMSRGMGGSSGSMQEVMLSEAGAKSDTAASSV